MRLWNPAQARTAPPAKTASANAQVCAAAPDGTWLAVATNAAIAIHDPETTEVREVLEFPGRVYNMAPLATGFLAAAGVPRS